jgi:hypothetical protein
MGHTNRKAEGKEVRLLVPWLLSCWAVVVVTKGHSFYWNIAVSGFSYCSVCPYHLTVASARMLHQLNASFTHLNVPSVSWPTYRDILQREPNPKNW